MSSFPGPQVYLQIPTLALRPTAVTSFVGRDSRTKAQPRVLPSGSLSILAVP